MLINIFNTMLQRMFTVIFNVVSHSQTSILFSISLKRGILGDTNIKIKNKSRVYNRLINQ